MGSTPWDSSRPDGANLPAEPVLWNAFANMASLAGHAVTIVRGEGSTVYDDHGRPYLDALASLWYCNVGHGRAELADAAAAGIPGTFATITRTDGTKQVTWNGHPLYTYVGDRGPGSASGNNLNINGGLWKEIVVSG